MKLWVPAVIIYKKLRNTLFILKAPTISDQAWMNIYGVKDKHNMQGKEFYVST